MRQVLLAGWLLALLCAPGIALAQTDATGGIRGIVLDRADGSPITDVSVRIQDTRLEVKTDAAGRFEIGGVAPGRQTVYVSTVGFILVKRPVQIAGGETLELTILLSEGTGTYSESVTVTAAGGRFPEQEKSVPAQQTLGSAEIQNLRNLLTNDPMRAIQVLPGVTTGDDFRSEFAVRGSGFARMNFTFDGIPTTFLLHTVQHVQDGGSIAMVNGDILDGITLLNGSYPERYGNRVGAELDFHMREGSRDRAQVRLGVSGTDASIVTEGPFGRAKRGSWLVSARKSYLELLLKQIDSTSGVSFGFSDVQSKLVYDLTDRQRLELSLVAGRSRLEQHSGPDETGEVDDGRNNAQLLNLGWRITPSKSFTLTERIAFAANHSRNENVAGLELDQGSGSDFTWRTDFAVTSGASLVVEGGGQVQRQQRALTTNDVFDGETLELNRYDESAILASAFVQAHWSPSSHLSITPGVRVDRWSLTDEAAASPWIQGEMPLGRGFKLRAGGGVFRQFPSVDQVFSVHRDRVLGSERAYHSDIGLEQTIGADARWQVTFYNREDRDLIREFTGDVKDAGRVIGSFPDNTRNALDGHARGVEFLLQRKSSHGLSGWFSYSLGFNRYRDYNTGESFDGDFDQRHTINTHGVYRVTDRFSLAGKFRYGSNVPATGYYEERNGAFFVGSERNRVRVPDYARLDIRASRIFNWQSKRMTLFVECLNVLGRDNVRYEQPFIDFRTRQVFGLFDSMIPRVPSAGILIEF